MHLPWRDAWPGNDGPCFSTSVLAVEADRLAALAAGRRVLEVGSAFGYSATVMALAGATVVAVDPHAWLNSRRAMEAGLEAYGVADRVQIVQQESFAALPAMAGDQFDLIFIDGDHAEDAVRLDVVDALPLLAPTGTLACHDYTEDCCCPGVRLALDKMFPGGPVRLTGSLAEYRP